MISTKLLTSTSRLLLPKPTLLVVRHQLVQLVAEGKLREALRKYHSLVFVGHLRERSQQVKKSLLRALWTAITEYEDGRFAEHVDDQCTLIVTSSDLDWTQSHQDKHLYDALGFVADDLEIQRQDDIKFGKCCLLVEMMCGPTGTVCEEWLLYLEDVFA